MTQAATSVRNIVARSGYANPIGLDLPSDDEDYIQVYADDELLSRGTDYVVDTLDPISVTIIGADDVDNYVGYESFTLVYAPTMDQSADLSSGGVLGRGFEAGLDALNRRLQAVDDRLNRALLLPPYVPGPVTSDTPLDGQVPVWNENERRFTWAQTPEQSAESAEAAAASAAAALASENAAGASETAAADSEAAAAAALASVEGIAASAFETLTDAAAFDPDTAPAFTRTAGYASVGDDGAALYKLVVAEPSHAGKYQDAAGNWYELAEDVISLPMLGAIGDGVTDNASAWSNAIDVAIAQAKIVLIPPGDFYLSAGKTITSAPDGFGIVGVSKMRSRLLTDQDISLVFVDCSTVSFNWLEFRNFRASYTGTAGARTAANCVIRYGQTTPNAATGVNRMTHDQLYTEGFYHSIRYGAVGRSAWSGADQIERYYVPVITNCHFVTTGSTGVEPYIPVIADRGCGAHGTVSNNVIEASGVCIKMGDGSLNAACGDQLIIGNHLLGTDPAAMAVDIYGPSNYATIGYNQNFTIVGNQFDGEMTATVRMRQMKNFRIFGNNSTATAGPDVTTNNSNYIVEDRNTVTFQDITVDDLTVGSTNGARFTQPLALRRSVNTDRIVVSGGNTGTDGAQLSNYGGAHATLANYSIVDADTLVVRNKAGSNSAVLQPTVTRFPGAYSATTAAAANVVVTASDGTLARSTSALKYKNVLGAIPRDMVDRLLGLSGFIYSAKDDPNARHYVGMAADHFDAAGLSELVSYGEDGEVEGLQYERITVLVLEELKALRARISVLEGRTE